jgi:hypothetical protein
MGVSGAEPGDPLDEWHRSQADASGVSAGDHGDGGIDLEEGGIIGVG